MHLSIWDPMQGERYMHVAVASDDSLPLCDAGKLVQLDDTRVLFYSLAVGLVLRMDYSKVRYCILAYFSLLMNAFFLQSFLEEDTSIPRLPGCKDLQVLSPTTVLMLDPLEPLVRLLCLAVDDNTWREQSTLMYYVCLFFCVIHSSFIMISVVVVSCITC